MVAIGLLIVLMGAHWMVFQSAAWVRMAVNYSRQTDLTEALAMTFDSDHPCELCLAVSEGKKADKESQTKAVNFKFECLCDISPIMLFAPDLEPLVLAWHQPESCGQIPPPLPPPRALVS